MLKILKSIGKKVKKLWGLLSGKKRNIALIYWSLLVPAVTIIWPEGAPPEIHKASAIVGLILSYLGLGHAAIKKTSFKPQVTDELPDITE